MDLDDPKKVCFLTSEMGIGREDDLLDDIVGYNQFRTQRKWRKEHVYVRLCATANGYFAFRVRPSPADALQCIREPSNVQDSNAIKVFRGSTGVGYVPRACAEIISKYIDRNYIKHVTAFSTGKTNNEPTNDFGSAVKLECNYFFEFIDHRKRNELINELLLDLGTTRLLDFP